MTIRQRLRRRRVLDTVSMSAKLRTGRPDFEGVGIHATIKRLCGKGVSDGNQGDIGLLTKRETKAKRPVRRQVAGEKIGERLARIAILFFLRR